MIESLRISWMIVVFGIDLFYYGGLKCCGSDGVGWFMVCGVIDGDFCMGILLICNVVSEVRFCDLVVVMYVCYCL